MFFYRYYQHLHTHNSTTLIVTFCMKVLVFWFGSVRPWVVIVLNYPPRVDIRCYSFVEQQHYQICSQLCHIYYILGKTASENVYITYLDNLQSCNCRRWTYRFHFFVQLLAPAMLRNVMLASTNPWATTSTNPHEA